MINPRDLYPNAQKQRGLRHPGGKFYFAVLSGSPTLRATAVWKRATEAIVYAGRLQARWIRLYDAWCNLIDAANAENAEYGEQAKVQA